MTVLYPFFFKCWYSRFILNVKGDHNSAVVSQRVHLGVVYFPGCPYSGDSTRLGPVSMPRLGRPGEIDFFKDLLVAIEQSEKICREEKTVGGSRSNYQSKTAPKIPPFFSYACFRESGPRVKRLQIADGGSTFFFSENI